MTGRIYYGYWLIAVAFVTQLIAVGVTNYVAGPFMIPMSEELGWSRTEYTIPRSLGGFVTAFVGVFIGSWVDRIGGRPFVITGGVVAALALWLHSGIETLTGWVLINGMLLMAAVSMLGPLVVNVTLSKWFVEVRGRAVAFAAMGVSFAGIAFTPAITWAIDLWGWRTAWQILAAFTLVIAAPIGYFVRRRPEDHGLHPDGKSDADVRAGRAEVAKADYASSLTRRQALRTRAFYLLIVAFGLFTVNIGVMLLQTVPYLTDAGYDRVTAALMITVASVPALVAKPVWGYFIDRAKPKPLAALGSAVTGLALVVIVVSVQLDTLAGIYVGFFLLGTGWGGMIPLQEVIWAGFFGRRYLGAVRSAAMPFSLIIGAGAPLAVSIYHDLVGDYTAALLVIAGANLVATFMILAIDSPNRAAAAAV